MERKIHNLVQGSEEWHQFRLEHNGASEAAAMLGLSKKTSRSELMRMKHSGSAKEFSEWVQKNILDKGHEVEALARPIIEEAIGEELYPATYSMGRLSASCDGLTMGGEKAFEHKQWNSELAAAVLREELPDEYMPQCQQIMLVTGAESVLFVVSDGTLENMASMTVKPDQGWQNLILAGWEQFNKDLATYTPSEVIPAAVAAPIKELPALAIEITGSVVASNLTQWREIVVERISGIKTDLQSDQDFADADKMVKFLDDGEKRIELVKSQAQAQATSIDEVFRALDEIRETMRAKRLELDRLVKARKESIRVEQIERGKKAVAEHVATLNQRIGKTYMPVVNPDFAAAIKGKRTVASLIDAVDTLVASTKIEASAIADRIQINLASLKVLANDYPTLFHDTPQIVCKHPEDFVALVKTRINEHKQAEADRLQREAAAEAARKIAADAQQTTAPPAATSVQALPQEQPQEPVAAVPSTEMRPMTDSELRADCNRSLYAMNRSELVKLHAFIADMMAQRERLAA